MAGRDDRRASAQQQIDRWEEVLGDQLLALFDRQEGVVLARLTGTKSRRGTRHWTPAGSKALDPRYILDPARWLLEAVNAARELITRLFGDVIGRVWRGLGSPPVPLPADEAIAEQVEARLEQVAVGVNTASEVIREVITRGEDEGLALDRIADEVRKTYAEQRAGWVARIVTTNVVGAMNEASLQAATAAGCSSKQWLAAHDTRVRPTHVQADGQVQPIGGRFQLGGFDGIPASELGYPGDPDGPAQEVINCRCTLLFPLPQLGERPYVGPGSKRFDPGQLRDAQGRWTDGAGGLVDQLAAADVPPFLPAPPGSFLQPSVDGRAGAPAELVAQVAALSDFTDPRSGMSARVREVTIVEGWSGRYLEVQSDVLDVDGSKVGHARREWYPAERRVHHEKFELDLQVRGAGFASRWNEQVEAGYRDAGFEQVTLKANIDVGGFAWARAGYDWDLSPGEEHARSVAQEYVLEPFEAHIGAAADRPDVRAALDAAWKAFDGPPEEWPTPFDLAQIGYRPGDTSWPGKVGMLGTSWEGVKRL